MRSIRNDRILRGVAAAWLLVLFVGAGVRVLADCPNYGLPFSDLDSETTFCAAIAEAYYSGLTNGTTATTFNPSDPVPRRQMVAFIDRTLDQSLLRGSRRAALDRWWTLDAPRTDTPYSTFYTGLGLTTVGTHPTLLKSDGADIWVANNGSDTVSRVRESDGKKLEDWTGASSPYAVLVALGHVFVVGNTSPGVLYMIDPRATAGAVTTVASNLGTDPIGIAFDGGRIWTANVSNSISIVTPKPSLPWDVNTILFASTTPQGMVFDGSNMWVTDYNFGGRISKLDGDGNIVQTIPTGNGPEFPAFDGHNIWIPNFTDNSLTVIRASDGVVLKTFSAANGTQNGLYQPLQAAFDGQRILVTNQGGLLSLFKATDLSVIGNFYPPTIPGGSVGACSDGINFWVSFYVAGAVGRF